ncbi:hypothetical protein PROFUN_11595 [Planoprotostelium fungivorum]|uniref:mRNA (guanine-N(7))-methyltransferase n=1 Tax=Planoprotostelium fungivorum TaxID=1890364 RepID=A0A2P6N9V5_9EUKA|nr:hypothetical protein PROFUN_11595 [Planoprotostelium fungivorum]
MTDQKTSIWQFKQHEQWVKTVLISDIVEPSWTICEFCCGKGLDLGRWIQKKKPFTAEFLCHDPKTEDLSTILSPESFNVVASFDGLQHSFESESKCTKFIENVAGCLKKGGYFFGLVPDSSAIWDRAQHKAARSSSSSDQKGLFSMEFPSDYTFPQFGSSYVLKIEDALHEDVTEYLVHFPTLIKKCAENGLEMLEISNLLEFYEDNKRNYYDRLKEMKVLLKDGRLDPLQKDLIGMYSTFVFQKSQ